MRLITKNTDYAIRALVYLANNKDVFVSCKRISEKSAIPYQFLRRIINILISAGFILSKEGSGGGCKLDFDPKKVKLIDIIEAIQGKLKISECMFRKKLCHNSNECVLRKEIGRIENMVRSEFEGITIAKLARDFKKSK